jgi:hypothetical protein
MPRIDTAPTPVTAIRPEDGVLLASLDLSQGTWLLTVLQPLTQRFSKFAVEPGHRACGNAVPQPAFFAR